VGRQSRLFGGEGSTALRYVSSFAQKAENGLTCVHVLGAKNGKLGRVKTIAAKGDIKKEGRKKRLTKGGGR